MVQDGSWWFMVDYGDDSWSMMLNDDDLPDGSFPVQVAINGCEWWFINLSWLLMAIPTINHHTMKHFQPSITINHYLWRLFEIQPTENTSHSPTIDQPFPAAVRPNSPHPSLPRHREADSVLLGGRGEGVGSAVDLQRPRPPEMVGFF